MRIGVVAVTAIMLASCAGHDLPGLEDALTRAGENRSHLEAVLRHFVNDGRKQEAARYLVSNLPYHHSVEGPALDANLECYRLYSEKRDSAYTAIDSLRSKHGGFTEGWTVRNDAQSLDSTFLIQCIDDVFRMREESVSSLRLSPSEC